MWTSRFFLKPFEKSIILKFFNLLLKINYVTIFCSTFVNVSWTSCIFFWDYLELSLIFFEVLLKKSIFFNSFSNRLKYHLKYHLKFVFNSCEQVGSFWTQKINSLTFFFNSFSVLLYSFENFGSFSDLFQFFNNSFWKSRFFFNSLTILFQLFWKNRFFFKRDSRRGQQLRRGHAAAAPRPLSPSKFS